MHYLPETCICNFLKPKNHKPVLLPVTVWSRPPSFLWVDGHRKSVILPRSSPTGVSRVGSLPPSS